MSVFCEFHKAWSSRFPGNELPAAWEEDVRANLTKHRAKVALLKEELEKEQFYVEYLEKLLEDVNAHKKQKAKTDGGDQEEAGEVCVAEDESLPKGNEGLQKEERGEGEGRESEVAAVSSMNSHAAVTEALNSALHQQHAREGPVVGAPATKGVSSSPVLSERKPKTSLPSSGNNVRDLARRFAPGSSSPSSKAPYSRSASVPLHPGGALDKSEFVTVINVSGTDGKTRKVPPVPPPKTFKRPISSGGDLLLESPDAGSPTEDDPRPSQLHQSGHVPPSTRPPGIKTPAGRPSLKLAKGALPPALGDLAYSDHVSKSPSNASTNSSLGEKRCISKSSSSASSVSAHRKPPTSKSSSSSSRVGSEEDLGGSGVASGASLENLTDDEPLYDTVAPDEEDYESGEYVLLLDRRPECHGGSDTVKSGASEASSEGVSGGGASSNVTGSPPLGESPKHANYVNIDFFLKKKKLRGSCEGPAKRKTSLGSDDEDGMRSLAPRAVSFNEDDEDEDFAPDATTADDHLDIDSGVDGSSVESTNLIPSAPSTPVTSKQDSSDSLDSSLKSSADDSLLSSSSSPAEEAERLTMYRCIISSIIESETIYLECLDVVLQYMKALKATLTTSQPVIYPDDFSTVFYRIPELHAAHSAFLQGLKQRTAQWDGRRHVGDLFKALASKLDFYAQFLQNYTRAVETVRRCSSQSGQFADITKSIKLRSLQGQPHTLEDLLHRPVARVQKNALVLHDLLRYTPENSLDHETLKDALRLTQNFLSRLSLIHTEAMFPVSERPQRHLVRNSFIVELVEGSRKLRHLFLFNDVMVCAKYKATGRAEKFVFEVKWFISLHDILVVSESVPDNYRETNPPNLVSLRSQASTLRDQIRRQDSALDAKGAPRMNASRNDKYKKKLAELEAELILASPNLPLRVGKMAGLIHTFLLTSEYERDQWVEAVSVLQANTPGVGGSSLTLQELQSWITAWRSYLKTNMGSFLLRSTRDESLLVGDLHIVVSNLSGLANPASIFICLEVDSYGHFFRKAKTKVLEGIDLHWNQDFILDLEGSETLRILCYEDHPTQGVLLRGKAEIELSRSWLTASLVERRVGLQDLVLTLSIKFLFPEATLRRVPVGKSSCLFGTSITDICRRERRGVPFVITRCIRECERRGVHELGIYRVSGLTSDIARLKKSFETNPYEAEQLIKEVDIHSVTGLLKLFLRELPEGLFTAELYPRFFEAFNSQEQDYRTTTLLKLFSSLPQLNQSVLVYLLEHLVKVSQFEAQNKMSLRNLATVFGPSVIRPCTKTGPLRSGDQLTAGTVDVMAQAGILLFFLKRRSNEEPIQGV